MSDLRTAAQQALEAMEYHVEQTRSIWKTSQAIDALRDALAQQTQTPCDIAEDGVCEVIDCCRNSTQEEQEPTVRFKCTVVDDQHPNGVPFEQWVNAPQQDEPKGGGNLPPPLQAEPVARVLQTVGQYHTGRFVAEVETVRRLRDGESLYTAPPRREWQSLSEEEIDRWTPEIHPVIRAVEAALKEKNA
jgi:hypothetical protein